MPGDAIQVGLDFHQTWICGYETFTFPELSGQTDGTNCEAIRAPEGWSLLSHHDL